KSHRTQGKAREAVAVFVRLRKERERRKIDHREYEETMQADLCAIRVLCGEKKRLKNSVHLVHPVKKTNAGTL
ncbi:MAG: hypothetical protein QGD90_11840, partial [Candidatus Hydrogenedentes bacterium]|nr:hypothetical protein [Candidatus Hydrogenedentota bacterium]